MAHIPYGYRIENGTAVIDPEQSKKLIDFIDAYLGGLSIKESRKASGIELTGSSILDYLRSGTYAGTEYYPPIVPEGTQDRILEELERRTHPGFSTLPDPLTVRTKIQTTEPKGSCTGSAAEIAAAVYDLITPAEYGRTFMNSTEQAMVKAWVGITTGG